MAEKPEDDQHFWGRMNGLLESDYTASGIVIKNPDKPIGILHKDLWRLVTTSMDAANLAAIIKKLANA